MISANSLGAAVAESYKRHADQPALMHKTQGHYQTITYRKLGESVLALAGELLRMGVEPGDRIALLSGNRPEWALVDFACVSIGAVLVPIYTSLSAAQTQYIVKDSGAIFLFAENEELAACAVSLQRRGDLKAIWVFDLRQPAPADIRSFSALLEQADKRYNENNAQVLKALRGTNRQSLATIIYTSGTSGLPKGVKLSHGNLLANINSILQVLEIGPEDTLLSLLPLAHAFERLCGHYLPLCCGATVAYAESASQVGENFLEIRPTVMMAVPRVYEKLQASILEASRKSSALDRLIFRWAMRTGKSAVKKSSNPRSSLKYRLADRLVFSRLRECLGGRLRFFVSGGAALPIEIGEFFQAAGIHVLEGYGLTESGPVLSVNRLDHNRLGTVGPPLPGVEIKISPDGEILAKGPNVMLGYHNLPGETEKAFGEEDFLRTGDSGHFDERGYLVITGRTKDILVTSSGRNIAPAPIENLLKSSPYISEAILIGDDFPYLTALIVPDFQTIEAMSVGKSGSEEDLANATRDEWIVNLIDYEITRLCAGLASHERVKKFALLPQELSVAQEELTPTMKVRRQVILNRYSEHIDKMYA